MEGENKRHGGRNLLILGVAAVFIAMVTTSVSLYLYHASGDIYLDRSRPGFLPDEEEEKDAEKQKTEQYKFSDTGEVNQTVLEEYIKELQKETSGLKDLERPFSEAPLTNESLGIPENQEIEEV